MSNAGMRETMELEFRVLDLFSHASFRICDFDAFLDSGARASIMRAQLGRTDPTLETNE